jgi:hypothetical protein
MKPMGKIVPGERKKLALPITIDNANDWKQSSDDYSPLEPDTIFSLMSKQYQAHLGK